jgi:hypothetical protein
VFHFVVSTAAFSLVQGGSGIVDKWKVCAAGRCWPNQPRVHQPTKRAKEANRALQLVEIVFIARHLFANAKLRW